MLKEFCPCNNQTWVLVNGVRQRSGAVQADPGLLGYEVRADEVGKTAEQLFDKSLRKVRPSGEQLTSSLGATLHEHLQAPLIPRGGALVDPRPSSAGSLHQIDRYWPPLPLMTVPCQPPALRSVYSQTPGICAWTDVCKVAAIAVGPGSLQREPCKL